MYYKYSKRIYKIIKNVLNSTFSLKKEWILSKLFLKLKKHFHFPKVKIKDNVEYKILQIKDKKWKDLFK